LSSDDYRLSPSILHFSIPIPADGTILAKNIENNGNPAYFREIWVPDPDQVMTGSFPGFEC
jgi:hypothetical protein